MDFDIQIVHSVDEVGQSAWDKLGGGQPFTSYRWYRYGEKVMIDCVPVYIILAQNGVPVARGTFWIIRNEPIPISWRPARWVAETLLRQWPLFVCRSPLSSSGGLILPEPPLRDPALEVLKRTAVEEAMRCKASFLVFDFMEQEQIQRSD
jgi:hypothetical protein